MQPAEIKYESNHDMSESFEADDGKKKKKKKKRDPNAPKHPMSAYIIFSSAMRDKVKEETGQTSVTEIAKELGTRWKAMDEEARKPYQEQANEDKERYAKQMAEYVDARPFLRRTSSLHPRLKSVGGTGQSSEPGTNLAPRTIKASFPSRRMQR